MAQKVVAMEARLTAAFTEDLEGVEVGAVADALGVCRQTVYKYRKRFREEGPAGLVERSRRPHSSPNMISVELEDEIVRLRKELPLDNGADVIGWHLRRQGRRIRPTHQYPDVVTALGLPHG